MVILINSEHFAKYPNGYVMKLCVHVCVCWIAATRCRWGWYGNILVFLFSVEYIDACSKFNHKNKSEWKQRIWLAVVLWFHLHTFPMEIVCVIRNKFLKRLSHRWNESIKIHSFCSRASHQYSNLNIKSNMKCKLSRFHFQTASDFTWKNLHDSHMYYYIIMSSSWECSIQCKEYFLIHKSRDCVFREVDYLQHNSWRLIKHRRKRERETRGRKEKIIHFIWKMMAMIFQWNHSMMQSNYYL